jgi:hypothetical protein
MLEMVAMVFIGNCASTLLYLTMNLPNTTSLAFPVVSLGFICTVIYITTLGVDSVATRNPRIKIKATQHLKKETGVTGGFKNAY